jgi:iron(II)-dependent oxidoreductase
VELRESPPGAEPRARGRPSASRARQAAPAAGARRPEDAPRIGSRPGWTARVFGWLAGRGNDDHRRQAPGPGAAARPSTTEPHRADERHGLARRLIAEDRYVFVLLKEALNQIDEADARPAWDLLHRQMALIPAGHVPVALCDGRSATLEVGGFFLDRYAVSNRQFQAFVRAGGYESLEIWPPEIWPSVSRFTDRTGRPGPRDWEGGQFPQGKADHPVVGVCWYEAAAYSRWVGKRLPTAAEWQKAGGWPEHLSGGECNRYPWGNFFDPKRANLWASGLGRTVAVDAFPEGSTPNGIFQMCGNVWEWLADPLEAIPCEPDEAFLPWKAMRRISGGAFNTYFPSEAICQFVTGQGELDRRDNIGFRCAVPVDQLRPLP